MKRWPYRQISIQTVIQIELNVYLAVREMGGGGVGSLLSGFLHVDKLQERLFETPDSERDTVLNFILCLVSGILLIFYFIFQKLIS